MSNPNTFINDYANNIVQFVKLMEVLRLQNDQIAQDSTLIDRYFNPSSQPGLVPRSDIVKADVSAAQNSIVQMLFTFDSGSPPQKAALYKMLP